ncbi:MAG: hypothetical protein KJP18_12010, partial [Gemmatimonadetes bacterium]|nr:hypothetical protein [Gemmatimonadota bacterium]
STWFLIYAVPFAAVVTGERRAVLAMLGADTAGVLVGAMATLQPWTHLSYNVIHVWKTIGTTPAPFRVSELQPFSGDAGYVAFAMLALLGWATLPELRGFSLRHAGATTALAGWVLAFSASRFWTDIGLPAMLALTALLLQRVLQARLPARAPARWVVVGAVAVALHASISANHGRRWESSPLPRIAWLSENPQAAEKWLPGDGGIVYSPEMRVFYSMYLVWPEASWQYVLGPEQGIMPREHLAVLHDFEARQSWEALQPWVDAMRPQDRLIVDAAGRPLPQFEGTEVQPLPHGLAIVRPVDAGATAAADRVDLSPSPLPGAPVGSGPPAAHPDRPGSRPRPGPHE